MKQINKSRGELRPSLFLLQHPRRDWGPRGRRSSCWQVGRTRTRKNNNKSEEYKNGAVNRQPNKCGPALLTRSPLWRLHYASGMGGTMHWMAVLCCAVMPPEKLLLDKILTIRQIGFGRNKTFRLVSPYNECALLYYGCHAQSCAAAALVRIVCICPWDLWRI